MALGMEEEPLSGRWQRGERKNKPLSGRWHHGDGPAAAARIRREEGSAAAARIRMEEGPAAVARIRREDGQDGPPARGDLRRRPRRVGIEGGNRAGISGGDGEENGGGGGAGLEDGHRCRRWEWRMAGGAGGGGGGRRHGNTSGDRGMEGGGKIFLFLKKIQIMYIQQFTILPIAHRTTAHSYCVPKKTST
jgi:hypothetical protein